MHCILLLLAGLSLFTERAVAPVANPTADDAGNCGVFGEDNAVPPVPGKLLLSCGGEPILSVLYAVYGQPKGKCGGADFGSGSASSFEDTNPQCKGHDVSAKLEALCVGKTSCTASCGSNLPGGATPCNDFFGSAAVPLDPCPNIPKWSAVVVECPSSWGWWFILLLGLGVGGYVGGFAVHAHKVQGRPLDASALPHPEFWAEVRSLVEDGVAYAKARALSNNKAGSGAGASSQLVAAGSDAKTAGGDETAGLLKEGSGGKGKQGYGAAAETGEAESPAAKAASDSEDDGSDQSLVE
jgi:hypothetical protein